MGYRRFKNQQRLFNNGQSQSQNPFIYQRETMGKVIGIKKPHILVSTAAIGPGRSVIENPRPESVSKGDKEKNSMLCTYPPVDPPQPRHMQITDNELLIPKNEICSSKFQHMDFHSRNFFTFIILILDI